MAPTSSDQNLSSSSSSDAISDQTGEQLPEASMSSSGVPRTTEVYSPSGSVSTRRPDTFPTAPRKPRGSEKINVSAKCHATQPPAL